MKRRQLLGALGTTGLVTLTGCLADGDGGGGTPSDTDGDSGGGTPSDTGTVTETPTPMPTPSLTGSEFTVGSQLGSRPRDSTTVSVDGSDIVVEGNIKGYNGCETPELDSINYDGDTLTIAVGVKSADEGTLCTQAIIYTDYTVTAEFENGLPDTVVVTHNRSDRTMTVTTTSP